MSCSGGDVAAGCSVYLSGVKFHMKKLLAGVVAMALMCSVAQAVESGLQPGDKVGAYNVKDITGPNAGTSLCYRCKFGARPVVNVFAREVNDDLAKLIVQVDKLVADNKDKNMAAFVTVLAEDADKIAPKLKEIADKNGIKNVPLTIFDGESGPDSYKIAKNADVTVMMWSKGEVKANVAVEKGKLTADAIKSVVAGSEKILN
jgi:hypothetical protein